MSDSDIVVLDCNGNALIAVVQECLKCFYTAVAWILPYDIFWWSGVVVSVLAKLTSGPVSTEVGDRIRVQFPVRDIYLGM